MKLEAMHRSPDTYRKTSPRRHLKSVRCHRLKWDPLPPNEVVRIAQHVMKKKAIEGLKGTVHISPDNYLTAEENTGKPQPGDCLMKAMQPVITSNEVPYLQMA